MYRGFPSQKPGSAIKRVAEPESRMNEFAPYVVSTDVDDNFHFIGFQKCRILGWILLDSVKHLHIRIST